MPITDIRSETQGQAPATATVDFELEVVALPVTDVDRAKAFYASLGWREDADFPIREDFRVPDPERRSYQSWVALSDPDGNGWLLQELTTRLPGR